MIDQRDDAVLVQIEVGAGRSTTGALTISPSDGALVVFVHDATSGRYDPGDTSLARQLHEDDFATLLFDLRPPSHESLLPDFIRIFDVQGAARQLASVCRWLRRRPDTARLPVGVHATGAGAAAALQLAANASVASVLSTIVARSGRLDLTTAPLSRVAVPTLLMVGEHDEDALDQNIQAFCALNHERHIELIPEATDLVNDPEAKAHADDVAHRWFHAHLRQHAVT